MNTLPALDALSQFPNEHHDVLQTLRSSRVGLLTNHTGQTIDGLPTRDALRVLDVEIIALFSPEHGFAGQLEGDVSSSQTDDGVIIHSLYGATRRPTPEMLANIDVLVFDIQDVGARFYTYGSTLAYALEECARFCKTMVVLDRSNPLGGVKVEGPMLDDNCQSFVGHVAVPVVHGLTLGELALLHKANDNLDVELEVVRVRNWSREVLWPQTQLTWNAPSPNLPHFASAQWYPSLCLLEFSGVAVGRGTQAPFQIVGAPWFEAHRVLEVLNSSEVWRNRGVLATPIEFTPTRAIYENQLCRGLKFEADDTSKDDAAKVAMTDLGLTLLWALRHVGMPEFSEEQLRASWQLVGSHRVLDVLEKGDLESAIKLSREGAQEFAKARRTHILY